MTMWHYFLTSTTFVCTSLVPLDTCDTCVTNMSFPKREIIIDKTNATPRDTFLMWNQRLHTIHIVTWWHVEPVFKRMLLGEIPLHALRTEHRRDECECAND